VKAGFHRAELLLRADPLPDDPDNARSIVSTSPIHGTEISGLIAQEINRSNHGLETDRRAIPASTLKCHAANPEGFTKPPH
jgi:hypothetical protein